VGGGSVTLPKQSCAAQEAQESSFYSDHTDRRTDGQGLINSASDRTRFLLLSNESSILFYSTSKRKKWIAASNALRIEFANFSAFKCLFRPFFYSRNQRES